MQTSYNPRPLKQVFSQDNAWEHYLEAHPDEISDNQIEVVEKMLACNTPAAGTFHYECEKEHCGHTKVVYCSCKGRACSACGVKQTEQWIAKQLAILPHCEYQHITLTMPDTLWPVFKHNPDLLNKLFVCGNSPLLKWAKKRGIVIGIFCVLHTFGRQLNWNVHLHISVTRGGLDENNKWVPIYFKKNLIEKFWRQNVIRLLRKHYSELSLDNADYGHIKDYRQWSRFLDSQYRRKWRINMGKKTHDVGHTVRYLGRYFKRPPIASSRLRHYHGGDITFVYKDHIDGQYKTLTLSPEEMIRRVVSHIPAIKNFRMVRHYGFLSNRKRGSLLPIVYKELGQTEIATTYSISYAQMKKRFTNVDPFECILCKGRMCFVGFDIGLKGHELVTNRRKKMVKKRRLQS